MRQILALLCELLAASAGLLEFAIDELYPVAVRPFVVVFGRFCCSIMLAFG